MAESLNTQNREALGSRAARRLRDTGLIPAILYGHGEENVTLSVSAKELHGVIRHGSQMVELRGALSESALIRDIQWDPFGVEPLHVDLTRVSSGEAVEVTVHVELKGVAPGTREGGILDQQLHEVEIRCPAQSIPEKFEVSINDLHLGQSIPASSLPLPPKASLLTEPEMVIVQCNEPVPVIEEEVAVGEPGEPEVISHREEETESESG